MIFQPEPADIRRFFCNTYRRTRPPVAPDVQAMETLAGLWIDEHPEYHAELADLDAALRRLEDKEATGSTTFYHLSLHLSISEQCSIDQPRGIRQAVELLAARRDSLHDAHHEVMEELQTMLWEAQRANRAPDGALYIERVQRRATRD
jgi:hypothetical protein